MSAIGYPRFTNEYVTSFFYNLVLPFDDQSSVNDYNMTHSSRYAITLNSLIDCNLTSPHLRVLELAASPYGMTALLGTIFYDLTLGGFSEQNSISEVNISSSDHLMKFTEYKFNAESDSWPFPDGCFDLVIACEVVEHLALDPMMLFIESNRVLKTGGHLFVSTPNAASFQNIFKLLAMESPGLNSHFRVPPSISTIYERHNREYTPLSLSEFFTSSGFEVVYNNTKSAYQLNTFGLPDVILNSLYENTNCGHLRGDTLNVAGRKATCPIVRYPQSFDLYLGS